ncbi:MAG: hypothetical protein K0U84_06405 [Actinomycetia bacterium]|nr:hypothetical protein [Actinomycetes bacterium]
MNRPEVEGSRVTDSLIRMAGIAGIIGGVAIAIAYLTHPNSAPPETVASAAWRWIHVGFMVSLIAGVFLLIALLAAHMRTGGGYAGFTGFALALLSMIFIFGLDYSEVFIFPTLAVEYPQVVERYGDGTSMPSLAFAFPVSGVLFVVGFVLFAWALHRKSTVDPGAAFVTILGTIVFGIGLSGLAPMVVVRVGAVIFGAGLVWLGVSLFRRYR